MYHQQTRLGREHAISSSSSLYHQNEHSWRFRARRNRCATSKSDEKLSKEQYTYIRTTTTTTTTAASNSHFAAA
jgi:hypothetical protein